MSGPKLFCLAAGWAAMACAMITATQSRAVAADTATRAPARPLEQGFVDPPASARPCVYWMWLNGYTNQAQLTRDLEELKDKGIRKAYIFDCGARGSVVLAGPAFMGPEWMKAMRHAMRDAKRLGIELGLITSSSWNAGGTWVTPKHASMGLYWSQKKVTGPARFADALPLPTIPPKAPKNADGKPAFWKEVAVVALPAPKVLDDPPPAKSPKSKSKTLLIDDLETIVDLTGKVDGQGRLNWDVPAGKWLAMRFICANTGQGLVLASPNSAGLAIDHFSAEATRMHFQYFVDILHREFGRLPETPLSTLYVCSYELRGAVWTPDFLQEFQQRRGYDIRRYLPLLAGMKLKDRQTAERFDFDYRKTQSDLLIENFYQAAAQVCHEHGLKLCAEAGGPGPPLHNVPVDALRAQGAIDIPRGEFWTDQHLWVVKETASAAHVYGKPVVDMESFTSWRHWQDGPLDLKPFADQAMCDGTNLFTFHTCPHSPPEAGRPGWVYHAGTHFGPPLIWWPKARPFVDYLARSSYLLQQGLFVADICYYYGDQGYNFVPRKEPDPSLGPGYDYDVINAEAFLARIQTRDSRLVLPDGMSYAVLVLPDREDMNLDVLKKLQGLVHDGATVVGPKPQRWGGLDRHTERDVEVRRLADELWGPCDGQKVTEHIYGKGKVFWGRTLREIFQARALGPDFSYVGRDAETQLDFIHRRAGSDEIYFIINKGKRWEEVDCTFRVTGKQPELWTAETGEMRRQPVFATVPGGTKVPLRLAPAGSVFVVFRDRPDISPVTSVRHDGQRLFPIAPGTASTGDVPVCEVRAEEKGALEVLAWQRGKITLETAPGKSRTLDVSAVPPPQELPGPWEVQFPPAGTVNFPKLISWTEAPEDRIKYFAGIATYRTQFEVAADQLSGDLRLTLDLGRVGKVADVALNGKRLGILWSTPLRVDITGTAKAGRNELVVEVANTWSNRLAGDARLPPQQRQCRTNMEKAFTWKVGFKETPLLESGLLGPARLIWARRVGIQE